MMANCNSSSESAVKLQDPETTVKPLIRDDQIPDLVWTQYGLKATGIKSLPSYDDLNFFFHADLNGSDHTVDINEHGYVLKVLNNLQSSSPDIIDAQNALCEHVRMRGIPTQCPVLNKEGNLYSLQTFTNEDRTETYGPYLIRVVTFVPGSIFYETPYIPGSFYNVGQMVAKLHIAIADGFDHSFFDNYETIWSLEKTTSLRDFFNAVTNTRDLQVVKDVVDAFENDVYPKFKHFTKGIIHGDINEQNLIMMEVPGQDHISRDQRTHDVTALLDFADVTKSSFIFDVAIGIAYLSIECDEQKQLDVGGHFLAGYLKHRDLNDYEMKSLKVLTCCRLCQSLVYGAHSYAQQPENEYLLTTSKKGWPLLHKLWSEKSDTLFTNWKNIIATYNNVK